MSSSNVSRLAIVAVLLLSTEGCGLGTLIGTVVALNVTGKSSSRPELPPVVSSVLPASGSHGGGTAITIQGIGFTPGATVAIGGIAATNVAVSGNTITATVPRSARTGPADVVVTTPLGGQGTLPSGFTYTNGLPTAVVSSPAATVTGNIVIAFSLQDPESDLVDVTLEVDVGSGFQAIAATDVLSGGLVGLTSSPQGVAHTLTWASGQTFGSQNFPNARVRITPIDETDRGVGTPGVSTPFSIVNNAPVQVVLSQPQKSAFDIGLNYTVTDLDPNEAVSVTLLTFNDLLAGTTGAMTVKFGQGLGPCPYSATGTLRTTVWNSLADVGYGNDKLVTLTVTVSDGKSTSTQTTNPFFVSNGPLSDAQTYPNTLSLAGLAVGDITSDTKPDIVGTSTQSSFPGDFTFLLNRGQNFTQLTAVQAPFIPGMPLPSPPTTPTGDANPIPAPFNTFLWGHMHPSECVVMDVNGDGGLDLVAADSIAAPYNFDNLLDNYAVRTIPQTSADVATNYSNVVMHQNTIVAIQKKGLPDVANATYQSSQAIQTQISPIVRLPGLYGQGVASSFPQANTGDNSFDYIGWFAQDLVAADLDPPGSPGAGSVDLAILHGFRQLGAARVSGDLRGCIVIRQTDPRTRMLGGGTQATNFYLDPTDMGQIPTHFAIGDLDSGTHTGPPFNFTTGPGSPDIIVANTRDDSLTFYLQFAAASWPPLPAAPVPPTWVSFNVPMSTVFAMIGLPSPPAGDTNGVAIGDLNGDGSNDFIVTGRFSKTAVIFIFDPNPASPNSLVPLTNGLLPFRIAGYLTLPALQAGRPAIGDVTGDGIADIVVPGGLSNDLLVFRNTGNNSSGTPQFAPPIRFTAGLVPFDCVVADLNRDGRNDVVTANRVSQDFSVFLQTSQGTLDHRFVPIPTGVAPTDLAAGDVTGDGIPKLVCSNNGENTLWVFGRNPRALLAPIAKYNLAIQGGNPPDICSAQGPHTIALADLKNRGFKDILVAMENVFMGTAVGAPPQPGGKTLVGGFEVIYGGNPLPAAVALVVTGTFNPIGTAVAGGSFLLDGSPDIVLCETGQDSSALTPSAMTFYKSGGAGYISSGTLTPPNPGGLGLSRIIVTDMDGDGHPDLVLAEGGSTSMTIYYNGYDVNMATNPPTFNFVGYGKFGRPFRISNPFGSILGRVTDIAVADVDGDGLPDIVYSGYTTAAAGVYFQTTVHKFTAVALPAGDAPGQVAIGDLNGDGLPDIAIPWGTDGVLAVYYQNPKRTGPSDTFFGPVTFTTATSPAGCQIMDVDGDGRNDVVVACRGANSLCVFLQR